MAKVSIVIPTHNRAELLERAVESAKAAGAAAEIVVVDDASTDKTFELWSRVEGITYLRLLKNAGLSFARNAGINSCSSEYIAFLDDDDLRLPDSLTAQVRALDANPDAVLCYGRCLIGDARRQLPTGEIVPNLIISGDIFWDLLESNFIPMPTVVARRTALIQHGLFNTRLTEVEDWDMWLRLSEHGPVVAVDSAVAIYRQADAQSEQMSRDITRILKTQLSVQANALNLPRAQAASSARRRKVRRRLIANAHRTMVQCATRALADGDVKNARQKMREAFNLRPFRTLLSGHSWVLRAG
ncbi:MAG TPA: glycosyltransferase [Pyrinomonadaceae bacterium]|nr:glycosyltransferase [Pyrinomonadaceae bacterium]